MKIRKSILAAATAATVSVSGVVAAPAFAAEGPTTDNGNVTVQDDQDNGTEEETLGAKLKANSSDSNGNWDPDAIKAWISVFTAALGLVGAVITFAQKNFNFNFNFPQF